MFFKVQQASIFVRNWTLSILFEDDDLLFTSTNDHHLVFLPLLYAGGRNHEIFIGVIDDVRPVQNEGLVGHKPVSILLPFKSNSSAVLLLVGLNTFDITKSTEKSSQRLLSVAWFWNVFNVDRTFSLSHVLMVAWMMMKPWGLGPTMQNVVRNGCFVDGLTWRGRWGRDEHFPARTFYNRSNLSSRGLGANRWILSFVTVILVR